MSGQVFQCNHRVTYSECTVGNHVYHSRYLDWMEMARGEFLRSLGQPVQEWHEKGVIFPVVQCSLQYRAPARYDDQITLEVFVGRMERVRLEFQHRVLRGSALLVEGTTLHVPTNLDDRPLRIPKELIEVLTPWIAKEALS